MPNSVKGKGTVNTHFVTTFCSTLSVHFICQSSRHLYRITTMEYWPNIAKY